MMYRIPLKLNRPFCLFLLSQGISNLGDAFQLVAVTSLLIRITGSGLYAAFGLACGPIISILFSALAGYLCDFKFEKSILVLLDLLRGLVVILFISKNKVIDIYILMIILITLDIFYNPPRRKMITNLLNNNRLLTGNSIVNGVSGAMFIVGPILAGFVINIYGVNIAFLINGISFFISAFAIIMIKCNPSKVITSNKFKKSPRNIYNSTLEGLKYCLKIYKIKNIVFIGTMLCFVTTSVNIAFYPYAFDVIKISDTMWGVMISIFYGSNVIAMLLTLLVRTGIQTIYKTIIPALFILISTIWLIYSTTINIIFILLLQIAEGTIISFLNTVLTAHLLIASRKDILGRVIGINDFINNLGKLSGVFCTYLMLRYNTPDFIFLFCAFLLPVYTIYNLFAVKEANLKLNS